MYVCSKIRIKVSSYPVFQLYNTRSNITSHTHRQWRWHMDFWSDRGNESWFCHTAFEKNENKKMKKKKKKMNNTTKSQDQEQEQRWETHTLTSMDTQRNRTCKMPRICAVHGNNSVTTGKPCARALLSLICHCCAYHKTVCNCLTVNLAYARGDEHII